MNYLILKTVSNYSPGDIVPASCFGFDALRLVEAGVIAATDQEPTEGLYEIDRQEVMAANDLGPACDAAIAAVDSLVKVARQLDAALVQSRAEVKNLRKDLDDLSSHVAAATVEPKFDDKPAKIEEKASDDKPKSKSK